MNLDFGQIAYNLLKNIEKVIFFILGLIWVIMSVTLIIKWSAKEEASGVAIEIELPSAKEPAEETDWRQRWQAYIARLKEHEGLSKYKSLLARDIFAREHKRVVMPVNKNDEQIEIKVKAPFPLVLKKIKVIRFPLTYKGFIELPNGKLLAQINWGQKTYLVKEGDKIGDYNIKKLTKEKAEITWGKNNSIILESGNPPIIQEFEAIIYHILERRYYNRVKKGEKIGGIEILEVTNDGVKVLFEGEEKFLEKEKP